MNMALRPMTTAAKWHVFLRHPRLPQADGLCYGRLDLPLPGASFDQAAARLNARGGDVGSERQTDGPQHALDLRRLPLLTSPAQRCFGLAQAWHHRHAQMRPGRLAPKIDLRLQEMHFGAWEGRAWSSIPREDLDRWAADVVGYRVPEGESFADVIARVGDALADLREPHLIVAHGGAIRAAWHLLGGVPVQNAASIGVAYAEPILIGAE